MPCHPVKLELNHPEAFSLLAIHPMRPRDGLWLNLFGPISISLLATFLVLYLVDAVAGSGWAIAAGLLILLVFFARVVDGMRIAAKDLSQY